MTIEHENQAQNGDWFIWYSLDMRKALDKLQEALDRAGMSQAELARQLGVTRGTVNNWISGARTPLMGHLQETARILNMTLTEILGDDVLFAETRPEREAIEKLRRLSDAKQEEFLRFLDFLTQQEPDAE